MFGSHKWFKNLAGNTIKMCLSQSFWVEWEHYVNTNEGLMFGLVLLLSKGSLEENRILTFISYNNASIILAGLMMQQVAPKTMPW